MCTRHCVQKDKELVYKKFERMREIQCGRESRIVIKRIKRTLSPSLSWLTCSLSWRLSGTTWPPDQDTISRSCPIHSAPFAASDAMHIVADYFVENIFL